MELEGKAKLAQTVAFALLAPLLFAIQIVLRSFFGISVTVTLVKRGLIFWFILLTNYCGERAMFLNTINSSFLMFQSLYCSQNNLFFEHLRISHKASLFYSMNMIKVLWTYLTKINQMYGINLRFRSTIAKSVLEITTMPKFSISGINLCRDFALLMFFFLVVLFHFMIYV